VPRYSCAIHIHTSYSDGTSALDDLIPWARNAGINVLLITDHHTMAGSRFGQSGWYDNVLVIVGYEHSDKHDENHLLIFGLDEPLMAHLDADSYVHAVREKGGVCFLAHPAERRLHHPRLRAYPWTASLDLPFDGIEVWNYLSSWAEGLSPRSVLLDYLFPDRHGGVPDARAIEMWDRIAERRPVAAIAGLDAHARIQQWGILRGKVFPYLHGFQRVRTCVETHEPLTGHDDVSDSLTVLDHLANGRSFMGNNKVGSLDTIRFEIDFVTRPFWGHREWCDESVRLSVSMGARATVGLWRSGKPYSFKRGKAVQFTLDSPGIYRISATRNGRLWFMTNHLRLESG